MLGCCEFLPKDIELRADSNYFTDLIYILLNIQAINNCLSFTFRQSSDQDVDQCRLSSPILAQQGHDLSFLKLSSNTSQCEGLIIVYFLKISYLNYAVLIFLSKVNRFLSHRFATG